MCNSYVISILQKCKSTEKDINSLKSHWRKTAWIYPVSLDQGLLGRAHSAWVCVLSCWPIPGDRMVGQVGSCYGPQSRSFSSQSRGFIILSGDEDRFLCPFS